MIAGPSELTPHQRSQLRRRFLDHIYPILTPLAVDRGDPCPLSSNLSLSLAVMLWHPGRGRTLSARVKVPAGPGRWLRVPGAEHPYHLIPIEEVVRSNVGELFPGMQVVGATGFRGTRNVDIRRDDETAEDLLALISGELRERRFAAAVRLEIEAGTPPAVRSLLVRELDVEDEDVVEVDGLLGLAAACDAAPLR